MEHARNFLTMNYSFVRIGRGRDESKRNKILRCKKIVILPNHGKIDSTPRLPPPLSPSATVTHRVLMSFSWSQSLTFPIEDGTKGTKGPATDGRRGPMKPKEKTWSAADLEEGGGARGKGKREREREKGERETQGKRGCKAVGKPI